MSKKIAFIGAGSFGFTRKLVRDILTFPAFRDATIALMDIDAEKLGFVTTAVNQIVEAGNYPARVVSTFDRKEALKDADGVVITILQGGFQVFRSDVEIPMKYKVDINVGDTRGPSGIFRDAAHLAGDAGHLPRHPGVLSRGDRAELHQSDGDALPRDAE